MQIFCACVPKSSRHKSPRWLIRAPEGCCIGNPCVKAAANMSSSNGVHCLIKSGLKFLTGVAAAIFVPAVQVLKGMFPKRN